MKTTSGHIAISATTPEKYGEAQQLAARLNMDCIVEPLSETALAYDYLLLLTPGYLGLQKTGEKKPAPFYIDFLSGKLRFRSEHAGFRKELLAKAIGLKPKDHPFIVDATAGLGRDSYILATLGFEVTLIERSKVLHALLQDALLRASKDPGIAPIISRMHLVPGDAVWYLEKNKQEQLKKLDIIYLDPMFPERQKSASPKKEMVILQNLLGKDENGSSLCELALTCANQRVVVKRPRLAAPITKHKPSFSLTGKSSRFDVYLIPR